MSDAVQIELIKASVVIIPSAIGLGVAIVSYMGLRVGKAALVKSIETHDLVNSQAKALLELTATSSKAEGKLEGQAEERSK